MSNRRCGGLPILAATMVAALTLSTAPAFAQTP